MAAVLERQLVDAGVPFAERESSFVRLHPEWRNRVEQLVAVYSTCQSDQLGKSPLEFQGALEHASACSWCRRQLGL